MAEKKKYKQGPQYDKAPTIKPLKSKETPQIKETISPKYCCFL